MLISQRQGNQLFFRHVDFSVIFTEREIRSLQFLLSVYKRIVGDYGYAVGDVKSSYLKDLLITEYRENWLQRQKCDMNKSELVCDVEGGGNYIDAAISSLGISDEQLIQNLALQTRCALHPALERGSYAETTDIHS